MLVSPKRHFKAEVKNPSIAKYVLYAYQFEDRHIDVPRDNSVTFKAVATYESYCRQMREQAFSFFLDWR